MLRKGHWLQRSRSSKQQGGVEITVISSRLNNNITWSRWQGKCQQQVAKVLVRQGSIAPTGLGTAPQTHAGWSQVTKEESRRRAKSLDQGSALMWNFSMLKTWIWPRTQSGEWGSLPTALTLGSPTQAWGWRTTCWKRLKALRPARSTVKLGRAASIGPGIRPTSLGQVNLTKLPTKFWLAFNW